MNTPAVFVVSLVLFLAVNGLLLYHNYQSSPQHDSETGAVQPQTQAADASIEEDPTSSPGQGPIPNEEPASEETTASPTKEASNLPPEQASELPPGEAGELWVVVSVTDAPAWLTIQEDGQTVLDQEIQPGFSRRFEADQAVGIWTGNGGATRVGVNGYDLGTLGATGEVATRTFTVGY